MEKIVIITPSLNGGGAEKVAVNLANYYASVGYTVDLVVFKLIGSYQSLVNDQVNLVNLNVSRTRYVFFKVRNYLKNNQNARVLSVIRDANIFVGLAALGLRLKCLVFREAETLTPVQNMKRLKKVIYKLLMKISYSLATRVIANSSDTKSDLISHKIVDKEKIKVIRNPVLVSDYEKLKLCKVEHKWFKDTNIKVILSVGRLHASKNFSFLISVFKDIYNLDDKLRLMIVGEGSEESYLLNQISQSGLTDVVELVPFQENIYPYYQNADVFALTSEWEGFGNVLVEALSVGLPVVSTNCPGGPKMILDGGKYGCLVPIGNEKLYAEALISALNEGEMLHFARVEYAKRFSVEKVAALYLKIMQ